MALPLLYSLGSRFLLLFRARSLLSCGLSTARAPAGSPSAPTSTPHIRPLPVKGSFSENRDDKRISVVFVQRLVIEKSEALSGFRGNSAGSDPRALPHARQSRLGASPPLRVRLPLHLCPGEPSPVARGGAPLGSGSLPLSHPGGEGAFLKAPVLVSHP